MRYTSKSWIPALLVLVSLSLEAQNWQTTGGSSERNGISGSFGPESVVTKAWSISDASSTIWGNAVFTTDDRFATSRVSFSPTYHVTVECRSLQDGSLLWDKAFGPDSKLYVVGMTEDAVYIHDYATDSLYAFEPEHGNLKWVCPEKCMIFGGAHGLLFTCDGDPVVNGPGLYEKSLMRLDRSTGTVKWYNTNFVSVGPAPDFCIYGDRLYKWVGAINLPTKLAAIDLNTGTTLFYSDEVGGEALQELPLTAGPDGTIYGQRDGGDLWAITDEGSSFSMKWFLSPENGGMGTYGNIGIGTDGSVYFADGTVVKRLDPSDGTVLNTSEAISSTAMWGTYIVTDRNGKVYLSNTEASDGRYYSFSTDLQTKNWEVAVPYNYYSGPQIGKDGLFIAAGAGTSISAYKTGQDHPPFSWFVADTNTIPEGAPVTFTDLSSFNPESWSWSFPGGQPASSFDQDPGTVIYDTPGTYPVTLVTANSFGSDTLTRNCYIHVEQVSFVSSAEVKQDIRIYPNPNDGFFTFSTPGRLPRDARIIITDTHGRLIFETEKQVEGRTVDIRGRVASGLYYIHCITENTTYSGKLIVR